MQAWLKVPDSFWDKVDASGDCWEWLGAKDKIGYGSYTTLYYRYKSKGWKVPVGAYRVAWFALVGWLPSFMTLDHLCRNPSCVNPDHLEPVTQRVNIQRGQNVGRPLKSCCPKGHPLEGANLYVKPKSGERCCRICRRTNHEKRQAGLAIPQPSLPLLFCKRGHDYSTSAYFDPNGRRHCRDCRNLLQRLRRVTVR